MDSSAQGTGVKTVDQLHREHAKAVASSLQSSGHAVGTEDVIPTTSDTPIPRTPELDEVGAEIVGEDISHVIGGAIGDLTTGAPKYRITKSGRFLKTLMDKLLRKHGSNTDNK